MVRDTPPTPNPDELNDRTPDISMSPEQARVPRSSSTVSNIEICDSPITREVLARADADFARIFGSRE